MNDKQTTRRKFLVAALTFSGITSSSLGISILRSSAAWAESTSDADDPVAMGRFAQLLFPHDGLTDDVYGEVMSQVLAATAADSSTAELLTTAEAALNAQQEQPWSQLDEAGQLAVMHKLEGEAFFASIRERVRSRLYYHPQFWKHINYPGSSKEHGGYINRGFDDIDWLPEQG
jgi:hypothetical protein